MNIHLTIRNVNIIILRIQRAFRIGWPADSRLHNPKRFGGVQRVTSGRLTLMFRFSLSGRSLYVYRKYTRTYRKNKKKKRARARPWTEFRFLHRTLPILPLITIITIIAMLYCTNQPAGRSFHFPNVPTRQTRQTERNARRKTMPDRVLCSSRQ